MGRTPGTIVGASGGEVIADAPSPDMVSADASGEIPIGNVATGLDVVPMPADASGGIPVGNASGAGETQGTTAEAALGRLMERLDDQLDAIDRSRHMLQRDILLGTRMPDLIVAQERAWLRERARDRAGAPVTGLQHEVSADLCRGCEARAGRPCVCRLV